MDRALSQCPTEEPDRRDDDEIYDGHQNGRRHPRQRQGETHPQSVNRTELGRNEDSAEQQQNAERRDDRRCHDVIAPLQEYAHREEGNPHGDPEAPPLSRAQSSWSVPRQPGSSFHSG